MLIIGFESSCDETGVAVACTERGLLAHALHSQVAMHRDYGGVVPELASRDHIRRIVPLTRQVLDEAGVRPDDLDDQKFLELAAESGARWLLSKDKEVLRLAARLRRSGLFDILAPGDWSP